MPSSGNRKLIFLVTEDWYFWLHRLPMARAARAAGFDVAVATRVAAHGERIRGEGFTLHPLHWHRRRLGPWASLAAVMEIYRLYRRERPLVVQHVSLKPALLGGIAALLARVPGVVSIITGTGYLAVSRSVQARVLAWFARALLPRLLLRRGSRVIVENEDDRIFFATSRPGGASRIAVFTGTGVDIERFRPQPEPPTPPIVAAYAGRMIAIKGVAVLVDAQQRLRRTGLDLRLDLAGLADPENPSSIDGAELERWAGLQGIRCLGHQEDVRTIWTACHVAGLASWGGEGLPVSLLEAAAMGRPIVATDVPGTREIARHGVNALLVPPGDAAAFADALATLARDAGMRQRFGEAGRRLVEERFSERAVGAATVKLYRALLDELGIPAT
jgi:glycosyltransferase involved in cell wall biosynthesis